MYTKFVARCECTRSSFFSLFFLLFLRLCFFLHPSLSSRLPFLPCRPWRKLSTTASATPTSAAKGFWIGVVVASAGTLPVCCRTFSYIEMCTHVHTFVRLHTSKHGIYVHAFFFLHTSAHCVHFFLSPSCVHISYFFCAHIVYRCLA